MRREFPAFWAKASTVVATPLIIVVALLYIGKAASRPLSELYGIGFSAIGITAALSAICLSAVSPVGTETTPSILRYSGEKFLHSCLLLIQVLFLAFAKDSLQKWGWIAASHRLKTIVSFLSDTGVLFLGATAAWSWYWAFSEVNGELWSNSRHRIEEINRSAAQARAKEAAAAASNAHGETTNGEAV